MTCSVHDCDRADRARGLCNMHYQRWRKHGDPLTNLNPVRPPGLSLADAFASFDKEQVGACVLWRAGLTAKGYGQMRYGDVPVLAHRVAYLLKHGEIPEALQIDHTCHNHACVNPDHLRPATNKQNQENRAGAQENSSSGIRGVRWAERERKWSAAVQHNGRRVHVGYFDTAEQAERAVIAKRLELFTHNEADRLVSA